VFVVDGCPLLRELPFKRVEGRRETSADSSFKEFMPRLQRFSMSGTTISEISFGEGVSPNLHELSISYCHNLKKIEGFCGLVKLQKLWINECSELEELPSVEHCRSLQKVIIRGCPKVQLKTEEARQMMRQGSFTCS
jgi:Leucine-rich repeat (LRR) protein